MNLGRLFVTISIRDSESLPSTTYVVTSVPITAEKSAKKTAEMWPKTAYGENGCRLFRSNNMLPINKLIGWRWGVQPPTRVVAQGLTPYCDQIVTAFPLLLLTAVSHCRQRIPNAARGAITSSLQSLVVHLVAL